MYIVQTVARSLLHGDSRRAHLDSFPTRRSSDLPGVLGQPLGLVVGVVGEQHGQVGVGQGLVQIGGSGDLHAVDRSDRKSTRLNSSHVAISYAVFCLKKKTDDMLARLQRNGERWR